MAQLDPEQELALELAGKKPDTSGRRGPDFYNKISLLGFITLSLIGIILPLGTVLLLVFVLNIPELVPVIALVTLVLYVLLFIVSYLKVRKATYVSNYTYIFIFTAPSVISTIFALLIPNAIAAFGGLIGIFISYFVLHGNGVFE